MTPSLTTLFDTLPGTLLITDENGVALYANAGMEQRTGFTVGEMIGKKAGALWGKRMDPAFYGELWDTIKKKKQPFVSLVSNVRKNNITQGEELHIAPVLDEHHDIKYFLELQPGIRKPEARHFFSHLFLARFREQHRRPHELISCIAEWMGGGARESGHSFIDHIERELIAPMGERFHERKDDHECIRAAKEHPEAFAAVYEKYHDSIEQYFFSRVSFDEQVSADLTQETFLNAFRYLQNFQESNASYRTYLLRIAHNVLVNYYRKPLTASLDGIEQDVDSHEHDHVMMRIFLKEMFVSAKSVLSDTEYTSFQMRYKDEMNIHEIAIALNITENAVKLQLSRGRKKLRGVME